MENKGLTITIVVETSSSNYGEGSGNVSELKKIVRGNGEVFTYISKQALKYNIRNQMRMPLAPVCVSTDNTSECVSNGKVRETAENSVESEKLKNNNTETPVKSEELKNKKSRVVQFSREATIKDYAELDLFGYMKVGKKEASDTRTGVVRVTDAVSLEPFHYDMDFLTNAGLASRIGEYAIPVNIENHMSYYSYTVTIDLDEVGIIDGENFINNEEKSNRIVALLNAIEYLYRDIRGDRKCLSPIFIIGGIYDIKSPFFTNAIKIENNNLILSSVEDILQNPLIKDNTKVGLLKGNFENEDKLFEPKAKIENQDEILNPQVMSIYNFFNDLKISVNKYYCGEK